MSPDDVNSLKTALRVLAAITNHVEPSPTDVESLRAIAPEYCLHTPDEIACEVIRRSLSKRAAMVEAA